VWNSALGQASHQRGKHLSKSSYITALCTDRYGPAQRTWDRDTAVSEFSGLHGAIIGRH
jgi:hypothetical protein